MATVSGSLSGTVTVVAADQADYLEWLGTVESHVCVSDIMQDQETLTITFTYTTPVGG